VSATAGARALRGGSPTWLGVEEDSTVTELRARALTLFVVANGAHVLAAFGLSDTLRPSARGAIQFLQERGCDVHVVSGDTQPVVSALAAELGLSADHAHGGCLPQTKFERVRALQAAGRGKVLFVGDGTNDALALAQADVGVALGSGTDLALSTAAVVLLDAGGGADLMRSLRVLHGVSRAAVYRIRANFIWAGVYNLLAVLLASGAFVNVRVAPQYAGLGEMVSVVPVVLVAWSMWLARW
jgi:P-type E1-E2 ATPase